MAGYIGGMEYSVHVLHPVSWHSDNLEPPISLRLHWNLALLCWSMTFGVAKKEHDSLEKALNDLSFWTCNGREKKMLIRYPHTSLICLSSHWDTFQEVQWKWVQSNRTLQSN